MNRASTLTLLASVTLAGAPVLADFDVSPGQTAGKINTSAYEDASSTFVPNVRVFGYEFGEDPMDPLFLEDPGFHPLTFTGLNPGVGISLGSFSALSYWDGIGAVNFGAVPTGENLTLERGSFSVVVGPVAPAGSLFIETTDANGEFDEHLNNTLAGSGTPAVGVYLFNSVVSGTGGLINSDPIYCLFNNGVAEDAFAQALLDTRDTFAPGTNLVPEPASLGLLMAIALPMARRRRT